MCELWLTHQLSDWQQLLIAGQSTYLLALLHIAPLIACLDHFGFCHQQLMVQVDESFRFPHPFWDLVLPSPPIAMWF